MLIVSVKHALYVVDTGGPESRWNQQASQRTSETLPISFSPSSFQTLLLATLPQAGDVRRGVVVTGLESRKNRRAGDQRILQPLFGFLLDLLRDETSFHLDLQLPFESNLLRFHPGTFCFRLGTFCFRLGEFLLRQLHGFHHLLLQLDATFLFHFRSDPFRPADANVVALFLHLRLHVAELVRPDEQRRQNQNSGDPLQRLDEIREHDCSLEVGNDSLEFLDGVRRLLLEDSDIIKKFLFTPIQFT